MGDLAGRRLPDLPFSEIHTEIAPGDYWKILDSDTGEPKRSEHPENLTGTCWYVVVPLGGGYGLGRLEKHTVREHEGGTISVLPNDGSSNSILVEQAPTKRWHGFIYRGVFRTAP